MLSLERSIVRANGATNLPMTTDTLNIPRNDDTDHTSNVFGGVLAYWVEETGTKTESEPKWGNCKLTAHKLVGLTTASDELLADTPFAFEKILKRMFAEAIAYYEDSAFITGTGVGQPLGFQTSGALITVARQANNNVRWRDLANIYARMFTASHSRAIWIVNQETLPHLITMVAENAAAAATAGSVIWVNPNQGAANNIPGTILGRPFFISEKVPALGSQGDVGYYDLSYYLIGDRSSLAIDVSKHVYFTTDKTAWRFVLRVDGQPWIQAPLTPGTSMDTVSPFVCLSSTS